MREVPECSICKLKCNGCNGYSTCLMRKEEQGHKIQDCKLMASKYYLFDKYLKCPTMKLCRYEEVCKSSAKAWL